MATWPAEVAPTIDAHFGDKQGLENQHINGGGGCLPMVSKCLITKTRMDAETETLIPTTGGHFSCEPIALAENTIGRKPENGGNGDGFTEGGPMYTLNATGVHGVAQPMAYTLSGGSNRGLHVNKVQVATCLDTHNAVGEFREQSQNAQTLVAQPIPLNSMNCFRSPDADASTGCGIGEAGEAMFTITKTNSHAVAQPIVLMDQGGSVMNVEYDISGTLRRETHGHEPVVMQTLQAPNPMAVCLGGQHPNAGIGIDQSPTLTNAMGAGGGHIPITNAMAVRRLTPVECERLQGFPDNYTDIKLKGKPTPDGPRYKALGNSMAVPVMAWIGKRIQEVESLLP
jgi:DNA (cytosine-5)-methyltransferase 1